MELPEGPAPPLPGLSPPKEAEGESRGLGGWGFVVVFFFFF